MVKKETLLQSQRRKLAEQRAAKENRNITNRIEQLIPDLNNKTNDQEEMMLEIMQVLNDTVTPVPDAGKFYTFVYNAKTPRITYDQHPLIACTEVLRWGFRGINFHLGKYRNYTWEEVAGQLYIVDYEELGDLLSIPYALRKDTY
jgi:hypothetical protein